MARRRTKKPTEANPEKLQEQFLAQMAEHENAEALNDKLIAPFIAALETVCAERGYLLNIYGESSNLVFSSEEDAEVIYGLVEQYLDERDPD
jgi:hypothetical protein